MAECGSAPPLAPSAPPEDGGGEALATSPRVEGGRVSDDPIREDPTGKENADPAAASADAPAGAPAASGHPDEGAGSPGTEARDASRPEKGARAVRRKPRDAAVARAFRSGLPVEGTVEKVIKGGYEIRVGKCRGFCPHSQIELHHEDHPETHVGKAYRFRITQMRRGGDDLVLSRRALLEEERADEAKAVRATLIEGAVMQGRVARLADFGAFVDLGAGVTGLVHVSEIAHARVAKASEALEVGDRVSVRVLRLDESTGKISLSMRQATEDPWAGVEDRISAGTVHEGTVVRIADFGAFVEMAPGVEALASAREFPPSPGGFEAGLEPGAVRRWLVLSLDVPRRRMAVAPAPGEGEGAPPPSLEEGARIRGKVQKAERFGVFVWLAPGRVGLVPSAWTGTPRGSDLARLFPIGREVEVTVVEVEEGGRRIRLTMDEQATARSRDETAARPAGAVRERDNRAAEAPPQEPEAAFGTNLGDALRSALERNRRQGS